ncbi:MAG: prepilin peptidase [Propionicimonas sp.]
MDAILLAVALAALTAGLAGPLLRWCPTPADADAAFSSLLSPRLRWALFATATGAGLVVFWLVAPAYWPAWAPLVSLGSLLALIDLRTTFLPLRLTYLGTALALAGSGATAWWLGSWLPVLTAAAGGAMAAGFFWVLWRVSRGQLGFGDVRLAGFIGVTCGASGLAGVWQALLLGTIAGALWGLVVRWRRGADGAFPYGPALLLGPLLALLLNEAWLLW